MSVCVETDTPPLPEQQAGRQQTDTEPALNEDLPPKYERFHEFTECIQAQYDDDSNTNL